MLSGLRKFAAIMAVLVVCAVLLCIGKLDAQTFANIIQITIPSFMAANLMEHICDKKR